MHRTRIKFCGITSVSDAGAAVDCGADAIGLVLHAESKRRIETERAKQIIRSLPPMVTPIGLFVDAAPELVGRFAERLGLVHVQLHGEETPEDVAQLHGLRVIKAIKTLGQDWISHLKEWIEIDNLAALLLDSGAGGGVANDFAAIAAAKKRGAFDRLPPIFIAGGLDSQNVGDVVKTVEPFAVDVSSGIEQSTGVKSLVKMQQFAAAVRDADR